MKVVEPSKKEMKKLDRPADSTTALYGLDQGTQVVGQRAGANAAGSTAASTVVGDSLITEKIIVRDATNVNRVLIGKLSE